MSEENGDKNQPGALKQFVAGGFGGMCLVASGHPLDTIKVRLQAMPSVAGEAPLYSGMVDCAKKTVQAEGFTGLYKGMAAPLAGIAPVYALVFAGYGFGQSIQRKNPSDQLNLMQIFNAGCISGIFTTIIMVPGERVKISLQVQGSAGGKPKYAGPMDVLRQVYRETGLRGIYRGSVATMLRDVPGSGAYFAAYEGTKRYFAARSGADPNSLNAGAVLLAGGLAGIANWVVALPADVLKTRFQLAPEGRYTGLRHVLRELIATEGYGALYKGAGPVFTRAFPANAACFFGYELSMKALNWLWPL